jgi:hypothetical protein
MLHAKSSRWNIAYHSHTQASPARRFFTMSSATLYRWSGIALLVGSLIGAIGTILDTVLYPSHDLTAQQVLSTPFAIDASLFLTAIVIGIYALVVGALGALLQAQGNFVIALVAAGLVAVLFQPLRIYLQRGVNRLMYGGAILPTKSSHV